MKFFSNLHWHQILISLLLGMLVGFFATQISFLENLGKCGKRGFSKQHMVDRLSKKLSLDAEQKSKLQTIFETRRPQMLALRDEIRPKFEALRDSTRAEIRKILNPEQQVKFEELSKKWDEKKKRRWGYLDSSETSKS